MTREQATQFLDDTQTAINALQPAVACPEELDMARPAADVLADFEQVLKSALEILEAKES